jgi:hypothetical protein
MKYILRVVSHWGLLLHIYVSMAGFTLVVLFAVTGLTLNHQDFGLSEPKVQMQTIDLSASTLEHPSRELLGKYLQDALHIRSAATDYREDDQQIQVTFAAPGHRTLVTIERESKKAEVEIESRGILGRLDDLHKGFDSGRTWYWVIDFTALLLTISSLTGMVTLLSLRARRRRVYRRRVGSRDGCRDLSGVRSSLIPNLHPGQLGNCAQRRLCGI